MDNAMKMLRWLPTVALALAVFHPTVPAYALDHRTGDSIVVRSDEERRYENVCDSDATLYIVTTHAKPVT